MRHRSFLSLIGIGLSLALPHQLHLCSWLLPLPLHKTV